MESFIERYDFATLISSSSSGLVASHIPIMLRRSAGKSVLVGHVAEPTAIGGSLMAALTASHFHGPHAYVSPSWYATGPAVPTWNYSAVHVYGKPLARKAATSRLPSFETSLRNTRVPAGNPGAWKISRWTIEKLVGAIVAFEMPIDGIEGNFKLGQNRSHDDRLGMLKGLDAEGSPDADALAEFIRKTWSTGASKPAKGKSYRMRTRRGRDQPA